MEVEQNVLSVNFIAFTIKIMETENYGFYPSLMSISLASQITIAAEAFEYIVVLHLQIDKSLPVTIILYKHASNCYFFVLL